MMNPFSGRPMLARSAAAMAALALFAAGCSSASAGGSDSNTRGTPNTSSSQGTAADKSASQVTLNIGDQAGAGSKALLTAAGLVGKLPFKVTWSDFTSGPPMLQAMGAGSVDVGVVGNSPPVFAAAGGSKISIIGALKSGPHEDALLVPKGSDIRTIAQLRGKRIAVTQGSAADYHLLTVLKQAGLSVHDVTLDYLQPAEAFAALSSGNVDAWDIWSPFVEQAQVQDGARVVVDGTGFGSPYGFEVASQASLADPAKATAIGEFLKLLDQAYRWAGSHSAAWAAVWARASGLPANIMVAAAKDSSSVPVPVTPAIVSSEQQVSDAFTASGLIPDHVNFSDFVDTKFNSIIAGES